MAKEIKTIGVLTSGGDAPGMNAAVRAIVRAGISKGYRMMGIQRGYNGLINGEVYEMNVRSVSEIIHRGGTILYTARCLEFKTRKARPKALHAVRNLALMPSWSSAATVLSWAPAHWRTRAFPALAFPAPLITILPAASIPLAMIQP